MSNTSPPVPVDYTDRDYASVLAALQTAVPSYLPEWTSTSLSDFGQVLLELFAYQNDILNYYLDRIANEAFLGTCQQLQSALLIAALIGYNPTQATAATAPITLSLNSSFSYPATIPAGSQFTTQATTSTAAVTFQTVQDYIFNSAGAGLTQDSNGNILMVAQGVTITSEVLGASTGAANQSFSLFNQPVISGSIFLFVDQGLGPKLWRQVSSLGSAGPTDLVYAVSTDANGTTWVTFGDGNNGAVPTASPSDSSGITATYQVGGGSAGNVGANQIVVDATGIAGLISSVSNPTAAAGGQDAETIVEIQQNAPQSLSTGFRGVSLQDYADLALEVPSVNKAAATGQVASNISLFIHPSASPLTFASLTSQVAALSAEVQSYIGPIGQAGSSISIFPPQYQGTAGYVPVAIAITITALPQYSTAQVQQDVIAAIASLLSFSTISFGQYISQGSVIQAVMAVPGVLFPNMTVMCRYEDLTDNNSGSLAGPVGDIVCAANELPVVIDPNISTTLIQITVVGGS